MEIHPGILAWRTPWTEEPGGLQSLGSRELDTTEASEHVLMLVSTQHMPVTSLTTVWAENDSRYSQMSPKGPLESRGFKDTLMHTETLSPSSTQGP